MTRIAVLVAKLALANYYFYRAKFTLPRLKRLALRIKGEGGSVSDVYKDKKCLKYMKILDDCADALDRLGALPPPPKKRFLKEDKT